MSWPWIQVAVLMTMTHVVRVVGDRLGPRWGAIVLGMPSTTAVLLVGGGCERGVAEAGQAAELGLLGLVAATTLPLCYAWALGRRRGVAGSAACGILGFVAMAILLRGLPEVGASGGFLVSVLGVVAGCWVAGRIPTAHPNAVLHKSRHHFILRTAVPAIFLLAIRAFRGWAGPLWAGLFATFPAMSLAVLVTLHMERGPGAVCRLARSMPRGNLGMVAFLVTYRLCCFDLGPFGAAAVGYLAVLVVMTALSRTPMREQTTNRVSIFGRLSERLRRDISGRVPPAPKGARVFAPAVESLAA